MIYLFINKSSNNGKAAQSQSELEKLFTNEQLEVIDVTSVQNAAEKCSNLNAEDKIIIAGGDGTLSRFVNDIYELHLKNEIYLYTCGTGNDFLRDIGIASPCAPVLITQYLKDLPWVEINDKKYYFILQ